VLAAVTGAAAVVRARRRPAPAAGEAPRWLAPLTTGVAAATLGAAAVAAVVRAGGARSGVDPRVLAGLPAVATEGYAFVGRELHVRAGQPVMLRVDNRDAARHSFDLDAFGVHVPLPGEASTLVRSRPAGRALRGLLRAALRPGERPRDAHHARGRPLRRPRVRR
jgi:hypothetical protein